VIHWTKEDGISVAVLDRPERRNALDRTTVIELRSWLEAGDDPAGPVVLTGAGATFCSGFDLTTRDEGADFKVTADGLFEAILAYPAPVLAALNGPAVGLGAVLAATCDLRIGSPEAWLEVPAARLGVVLDERYIGRIRDRLGMPTAQLLFLASNRIAGPRAFELGALHALVDDPLTEAKAWAARLLQLSASSLAVHKSFINGQMPMVTATGPGGQHGSQ
jgi:enoyl-CoA hydratase